jgi:hypothetical protein
MRADDLYIKSEKSVASASKFLSQFASRISALSRMNSKAKSIVDKLYMKTPGFALAMSLWESADIIRLDSQYIVTRIELEENERP